MIHIKPSDLNDVFASEGSKEKFPAAKERIGWTAEIPLAANWNYYVNRQDTAIAYFNQRGIPEWDETTEYVRHKSYVVGSSGKIYVAKENNTGKDPDITTDGSWGLFFDPESVTAIV